MPISEDAFISAVVDALSQAETQLPSDVVRAIEHATTVESNNRARGQLVTILNNARLAADKKAPMCQDTGVPTFYVEIGREACIDFDVKSAISSALSRAAATIPLRSHAVDPLTREIVAEPVFDITFDVVDGDRLAVALVIKGAGSENMSSLNMLSPLQDVRSHILEVVWANGGKSCPPLILGIGIGGTFDGCSRLAKKALTRSLDEVPNDFEAGLLRQINELGIGPMGLGGDTTALHVFVEKAPCHTATLPIAIAVQCWADRKASFFVDC